MKSRAKGVWGRVEVCRICGKGRCSFFRNKYETFGWCWRYHKGYKMEHSGGKDIIVPPPRIEDLLQELEDIDKPKTIKWEPIDWPDNYSVVQEGSLGYNYLINRGVAPWQIRSYFIGVSPVLPWRVIIPETDGQGNLFFYTARAIDKSWNPRYLTPKGKPMPVFNITNAARYKEVVVCEGPFDAIMVGLNAVATYGKRDRLSRKQLNLFTALLPRETVLTVCFDGDAQNETYATAQELSRYFPTVKVALLPPGADPGDLGEKVFKYIQEARPFDRVSALRHRLGEL